VVLMTPDGRGRVFYLDKRREVKIRYRVEGGKRVISSVAFAEQPAPAVDVTPAKDTPPPKEGKPVQAPAGKEEEGTAVQGTVYKVAGENQFIIRTPDGEEVTLYAQPQTTYRFGNVTARFADLRPGMEIRATYDTRDRRNMVRSVVNVPSNVPKKVPRLPK
jgi:trehalose utilization protein